MQPEVAQLGLCLERRLTIAGQSAEDVLDAVRWARRSASITDASGNVVFEQHDLEFPEHWSQTAVNVVASKYFKGKLGTEKRESSVRQLILRVVCTITEWGIKLGHLTAEDSHVFRAELAALIVTQQGTFNSPVWFNVGILDQPSSGWVYEPSAGIADPQVRRVSKGEHRPQCSACFITHVSDDMESILDWVKTEGMIFKYGSGSGVNVSGIRSDKEFLSSGGRPSGPLSFMKINDVAAGSIKSGGKHRRAAKMVILNADHPNVLDFIHAKVDAEDLADKLIAVGFSKEFNAENNAYSRVDYQNANHSVRATDEFMNAALNNGTYWTKEVSTGKECEEMRAHDVLMEIAKATHRCGDPGMQFDTTINAWHTCPQSGRINASNPCSEFMFLDNTACNLASLNLMQFRMPDGSFDTEGFRHAVSVFILAQEILVDTASYPTQEMAEMSHRFRPLGLGFANLGAYLMSIGLPYDSDAGRDFAAAVTSLMTGHAYYMSALIAQKMGAFEGYERNDSAMIGVIEMHRAASDKLARRTRSQVAVIASESWEGALTIGARYGFRNSQVTVLAPTGTIGFMLDCDTTGIEPELALKKWKKLVGGGGLDIVNGTVQMALGHLGYSDQAAGRILDYVAARGTVEGCPDLQEQHLKVFDCSLRSQNGSRSIHYMGHINMMAACQPFLSGAISKTINMPEEATVQDIYDAYIQAWKLGLKAVAIYRDNCKRSQPLSTKKEQSEDVVSATPPKPVPYRHKMPDTRKSITHKFNIAGHKGHVIVGLYEDGTPGELFISMAKEGSIISGLMDNFSIAISYGLQYGVPLEKYVQKFSHTQFEPSGWTGNPEIGHAKSILDYIFRWLEVTFIQPRQKAEEEKNMMAASMDRLIEKLSQPPVLPAKGGVLAALVAGPPKQLKPSADAPPCADCGAIMVRNGSCFKCCNCGSTSGCS